MSEQKANKALKVDGLDRTVLKQIQSAHNRRTLNAMPSFRTSDADMPDHMVALLKKMERAEAQS